MMPAGRFEGAVARLRGARRGVVASLLVASLLLASCSIDATAPVDASATTAAAESGDAAAMRTLGLQYERGVGGVPADPEIARQWYERAAAEGDAAAAFHLGSLYERGSLGGTDYAQAARWYAESAEAGNESAQAALAYLYERGLGVPRDFAKAAALYREAAARWRSNREFPAEPDVAVAMAKAGATPPADPRAERATVASDTVSIDFEALNEVTTAARRSELGEVEALARQLEVERARARQTRNRAAKAETKTGTNANTNADTRPDQVLVEIAAVTTAPAALGEWERLRRTVPAFDGLKVELKTTSPEPGQARYRLIAGPFPNTEKTVALCGRLMQRGLRCLPAKP